MRTTTIVKQALVLFIAGLVVAFCFALAARVRVAYGGPEKAVVSRAQYNMAVRGQWRDRQELKRAVRVLRRDNARLRQAVRRDWQPSAFNAIKLASIVYRQNFSDLLRVAECETGGTLSPHAKNRSSSASGLFQFLYPSTWSSTPFAGLSVWDPYANALAAGWMWANGRRGEWVCR